MTNLRLIPVGIVLNMRLSQHIHNNIHGEGEPLHVWAAKLAQDSPNQGASPGGDPLTALRSVYEAVCAHETEAFFRDFCGDADPTRDIVIVHDPQPAGMIPAVRARGLKCVWRCHIGLDVETDVTRSAWDFIL